MKRIALTCLAAALLAAGAPAAHAERVQYVRSTGAAAPCNMLVRNDTTPVWYTDQDYWTGPLWIAYAEPDTHIEVACELRVNGVTRTTTSSRRATASRPECDRASRSSPRRPTW